jgi:hypothetical protein
MRILLKLLLLFSLAACSSAPASTPSFSSSGGASKISVTVASDEFSVGTPRVPIVLFNGPDPIGDAQTVHVTAFDLGNGGATPTLGWSGDAVAYNDYSIPYWTIYPQLPRAGIWGLKATIVLADGTQTDGQFAIQVVDKTDTPDLGEVPPASDNRTLKTVPDLAQLTSDSQPDPDLYQMTVAEALKTGRPTVVSFATPGYCTSRLCAPVVNTLKTISKQYQNKINFIHIEVYKNFNPLVYADEMAQWHLQSEPWTFVLDAGGKIVARLGGPVSVRELQQILDKVPLS